MFKLPHNITHLTSWQSNAKFSKPGFNSTWTKNVQMFKLDLEKAEEPEISFPTSTEPSEKQESSRKTSTFPYCLCQSLWLCRSQQTVEKSSRHGNTRPLDLHPEKSGQAPTVRTGHGTTDWFQIDKGVWQHCTLSPCLFNLYTEYIMQNARLDESQTGIRNAGRNINSLRYVHDTTLIAENEEELNSLLMRVKEESEKLA